MTKKETKRSSQEIKSLMSQEEDFLRPLMKVAVQEVLEAEMEEALGAAKGERSAERQGYRSGYYQRKLVTRVGTLELRVPQDRQGRFSTEVFARYQRSEKALVAALVEMYVQGVSTRKVKAISEELCGHEFSASTVSELNKKLDEELARFAGRRLEEEYPYVILDARYSAGAGGGRGAQPRGLGGDRNRLAGAAPGDWGGAGQPGERDELERLFARAQSTRVEWGAAGGKRSARRLAARGRGSFKRSGLAALLRAFFA